MNGYWYSIIAGILLLLAAAFWLKKRSGRGGGAAVYPTSSDPLIVHHVSAVVDTRVALYRRLLPPSCHNKIAKQSEYSRCELAMLIAADFLGSVMSVGDRVTLCRFADSRKPHSLSVGAWNKWVPTVPNELWALATGTIVHGYFETRDKSLHTLQAMAKIPVFGSTNLYDSIMSTTKTFFDGADHSRPWIYIVLTDGNDNVSSSNAISVAQQLANLNKPANNFVFVVGLGSEVEQSTFREICNVSGAMFLHAVDTQMLKLIFALIAIKITERTEIDIAAIRTQGAEAIFARAQRSRSLSKQPVDICLLFDYSTSMVLKAQ